MKPFKRAYKSDPTPKQMDAFIKMATDHGYDKTVVPQIVADLAEAETYINDMYEVTIRRHPSDVDDFPDMIHLGIKRRDKESVHDWRDLQEIKNMLVGPEYEAVELYPAESRLIDSANQYHLWIVDFEGFRWPFGFNERLVTDIDYGSGAKQRPLK